MSNSCDGRRSHILVFSLLLTMILVGMSSRLAAQDQAETPPKIDLFVGYQWLNPGGQVPESGQPADSPVAVTPPGMGKGLGSAVAYNFTSHWAFEVDFGHNWNDFGYETTVSGGPRLMFRTPGMNYFVHTLLGVNRFDVSTVTAGTSAYSDNGMGAILGGGIDLPVVPRLTLSLIHI